MHIDEYIQKELFRNKMHLVGMRANTDLTLQTQINLFKEAGVEIIVNLDRNIFCELTGAVKRGSFSKCKDKKEITAFLLWVMVNQVILCPFYAIMEAGNGRNKEMDLFEYLIKDVGHEIVIKSYYDDNICFAGKSFKDANDSCEFNGTVESADYYFLYATVIHLVYVLRSKNKTFDAFNDMIKWLFNECLLSEVALAYIILLFTKDGIEPPHHYMDDTRVWAGCKNEAMDLLQIQQLDWRRYPSEKYEQLFVTFDKTLYEVAVILKEDTGDKNIEELFEAFCKYANSNGYVESLKDNYRTRKRIDVNMHNALDVSKSLVDAEKRRLLSIL